MQQQYKQPSQSISGQNIAGSIVLGIVEVFNPTSGYARLVSTHTAVTGRLVFVRFRAETGDAMGMNMLSKVREEALEYMIIIKLH